MYMTIRFKNKYLPYSIITVVAILIVAVFQNCSKVQFDPVDPKLFESSSTNPSYADGKMGESVNLPDLNLMFVLDNSATMKESNIQLSESFKDLFAGTNATNLALFNTKVSVINTAQNIHSDKTKINYSNPTIPDLLAANFSNYGSVSKSALESSDRGELISGQIPGDAIGFEVTKKLNTFGVDDYYFNPARVVGLRANADGTVAFVPDIRKAVGASVADLNADFKYRLDLLNPDRNAFTDEDKVGPIMSDESGLCALARILKNSDTMMKPSDIASFIFVGDEDDVHNAGLHCVDSIKKVAEATSYMAGTCDYTETKLGYKIKKTKIEFDYMTKFVSGSSRIAAKCSITDFNKFAVAYNIKKPVVTIPYTTKVYYYLKQKYYMLIPYETSITSWNKKQTSYHVIPYSTNVKTYNKVQNFFTITPYSTDVTYNKVRKYYEVTPYSTNVTYYKHENYTQDNIPKVRYVLQQIKNIALNLDGKCDKSNLESLLGDDVEYTEASKKPVCGLAVAGEMFESPTAHAIYPSAYKVVYTLQDVKKIALNLNGKCDKTNLEAYLGTDVEYMVADKKPDCANAIAGASYESSTSVAGATSTPGVRYTSMKDKKINLNLDGKCDKANLEASLGSDVEYLLADKKPVCDAAIAGTQYDSDSQVTGATNTPYTKYITQTAKNLNGNYDNKCDETNLKSALGSDVEYTVADKKPVCAPAVAQTAVRKDLADTDTVPAGYTALYDYSVKKDKTPDGNFDGKCDKTNLGTILPSNTEWTAADKIPTCDAAQAGSSVTTYSTVLARQSTGDISLSDSTLAAESLTGDEIGNSCDSSTACFKTKLPAWLKTKNAKFNEDSNYFATDLVLSYKNGTSYTAAPYLTSINGALTNVTNLDLTKSVCDSHLAKCKSTDNLKCSQSYAAEVPASGDTPSVKKAGTPKEVDEVIADCNSLCSTTNFCKDNPEKTIKQYLETGIADITAGSVTCINLTASVKEQVHFVSAPATNPENVFYGNFSCESECKDSTLCPAEGSKKVKDYITEKLLLTNMTLASCVPQAPVLKSYPFDHELGTYKCDESKKAIMNVTNASQIKLMERKEYVSGTKADGSIDKDLITYITDRTEQVFGDNKPFFNFFIVSKEDKTALDAGALARGEPANSQQTEGVNYVNLANKLKAKGININVASIRSSNYSDVLKELSEIIRIKVGHSIYFPQVESWQLVRKVWVNNYQLEQGKDWVSSGGTITFKDQVKINRLDKVSIQFY